MSAEAPKKPGSNLVIDYWPSWSDWGRNSLAAYKKGGKKERVDVINIAFALPQSDGSVTWTDVDKSEGGNYQKTKKIIEELRQEGKKVMVAIGGATAHSWNLDSDESIRKLAQNIKNFVDEYGLNGIDIDYEMLDRQKRDKVADLIIELRKIMPQDQYLISYAAWSTGAYGKDNPGHEHPEWSGGNEGIDINVLKKAGHLLDWTNIMSYDAFDPNVKPPFNPIQAIEAYKSLMKGDASKVVLGLELGMQGWPQNVRKTSQEAEAWVKYAAENAFNGVMFWTLEKDVRQETGEGPGAFLEMVKKYMPVSKVGIYAKKDQKHLADKGPQKVGAGPSEDPGNMGKNLQKVAADASEAKPSVSGTPVPDKKDKEEQNVKIGGEQPAAQQPLQHQYNMSREPAIVKASGSLENNQGWNLRIEDLTQEHQQQVLKLQQGRIEQINQRKASYDVERKKLQDQLKNEKNPHFLAGLEKQYKDRNDMLDADVLATEKHFQSELQHLIAQLREQEKASRSPSGGPS